MGDTEKTSDSQCSLDERNTNLTEDCRSLLYEAMLVNEEGERGRETVQHISTLICKSNVLVKDVKNAVDAVIDAKFLNASSSVLKQAAETMNTNLHSFTAGEYSKNILSYLKEMFPVSKNNSLMWQKIAPVAAECFSRTPSYMYMLGTFEVGEVAPAQRKARKQRSKQEVETKKEPENVKCIDKDGDGVEETVHYVMNVLTAAYRRNKNKPICFFKLVINPDSFGATVENIFHVSFLVKDGYVDLSLEEDGLPVIAPVPRETAKNRKKCGQEKEQMILQINMQQWEELKKAFEITEAMLKPRSIVTTQESSN